MGKAILSNRIYLTKTPELFTKCMKILTHKIPPVNNYGMGTIITDIILINDGVFSIPIGRQDLIPSDYQVIDKRILAPTSNLPNTRISLRVDQSEIIDQIQDNAIINAKPGFGKTFMGLHLAKKLGQKTLVVTHTTALRDQWVEETEKIFGFEPDIIGSGRTDSDTDIVISNVQTLDKHLSTYSQMFGTLLVDEVHRTPANYFKKIVDASYARYKIGLSATLKRKDGKHVIIPDYFSTDTFIPENDTAMQPTVYAIHTSIEFPKAGKGQGQAKGAHYTNKITELLQKPEYIELVATIVDTKANIDGHKVLCVSDRLEFIDLVQRKVPKSVQVTSFTKDRPTIHKTFYKDNPPYTSLIGTTSIYKEGISINPLSCLVLTVPINNAPLLEQIIGRVTRPHPGKRNPEIIDIVIKGNSPRRAFNERVNYYLSKGYEVKDIYI